MKVSLLCWYECEMLVVSVVVVVEEECAMGFGVLAEV